MSPSFIVDNSSFLEALSTRVGQKKKLVDTQFHEDDIDADDLLRPPDRDGTDDNTADAFKKLTNIGRCRRCPQNPTSL